MTPKVKVNDIKIYYETRGKGFPLVMINGLGGSLDEWNPCLTEELSKQLKLLLFDNRGSGRTDTSDREYTIKLFADDTAGLMNALKISKANILGLSMGGMIAQELVLNHPEKVAKLVLCSTFSGGSRDAHLSQDVSKMLTADRSTLSQEEMARMALPFLFTHDFIEKNPEFMEHRVQQSLRHPTSEQAYTRQLNAIQQFNTNDRLRQVKVPTLIFHGRKDVLIPLENGSILAKAIPNARLVCLEKSAHLLIEETNKVITLLTDFLA